MNEDSYLCCKNYCKVKTGGYLVAYFESISLTALAAYISANVAVRRACCDAAQTFALIGCALQSLFLGVLVVGLWRERIAFLRFSLITVLLRILLSFMLTVSYGMMSLLSAYSTLLPFAKFSTSDTLPFLFVLLANSMLLIVCFYLLRKYLRITVDVEINVESTVLSRSTKADSLRRDTTVVTDAADDNVADIEAQLKTENETHVKNGNTVVDFDNLTEYQTQKTDVPIVFATVKPFFATSKLHSQKQQSQEYSEQHFSCAHQKQHLWVSQRYQSQKQQRTVNNINRQSQEQQCHQLFKKLDATTNTRQKQQQYKKQQQRQHETQLQHKRQQQEEKQQQLLEVVLLEKKNVLSRSYNPNQQHYCKQPSPTTVLVATHLTAQRRPTLFLRRKSLLQ